MCAHVGSVNGPMWPLTEGGWYVNVIASFAASQAWVSLVLSILALGYMN